MMEVSIVDFIPLFQSGLTIGIFSLSVPVGGMLIYYASKIFKIMGGG